MTTVHGYSITLAAKGLKTFNPILVALGKREAEPGYGYRSYSSGYSLSNNDHTTTTDTSSSVALCPQEVPANSRAAFPPNIRSPGICGDLLWTECYWYL